LRRATHLKNAPDLEKCGTLGKVQRTCINAPYLEKTATLGKLRYCEKCSTLRKICYMHCATLEKKHYSWKDEPHLKNVPHFEKCVRLGKIVQSVQNK